MTDASSVRRAFGLSARFRTWLRNGLIVAVFGLFPLALLVYAALKADEFEVERREVVQREKHEKLLTYFRTVDDDSALAACVVKRVFKQLRPATPAERKLLIERLAGLYPRQIDLCIFDREGRLLADLSSSRFPRRAIEAAFAALRQAKKQSDLSTTQKNMLESLFHSRAILQAPERRGRLHPLMKRETDSSIFWDVGRSSRVKADEPAGCIALFHEGRFKPDKAIEVATRMFNRRSRQIRVGWLDSSGRRGVCNPPELARAPGVLLPLLAAVARFERRAQAPTWFATIGLRNQRGYLVVAERRAEIIPEVVRKFWLWIAATWILWVTWRAPRIGAGFGARIPLKLAGLFLFAVGIPSLLLLGGGWYALRDHARVLRQDIDQSVQAKVQHFDDRFPEELSRLERFISRRIDRCRRVFGKDERRAILGELVSLPALEHVFVIDAAGKRLFEHFSPTASTSEGAKVMLFKFAKAVLRQFTRSDVIDGDTFLTETAGGIVDGLTGSKSGFHADAMLTGLGRLRVLTLGTGGGAMFLNDVLPNRAGDVEHVVEVSLNIPGLEMNYCREQLPRLRRSTDLPLRVSSSGRPGYGKSAYHRDGIKQMVETMAAMCRTQNTIVRKVHRARGTDWLWMAIPSRSLTQVTLVAETSLAPIDQTVSRLWRRLLAVAALILLSTTLIGWLLAEQFLMPLGDLTQGVQAIDRREFQHRIAIRANDELGNLAELMNRVIEGMQELEIARVVQESLFPKSALAAGPFTVYGRSIAMTDIGGDYFDYCLLGERRLVGLVGDVSGHGVPAALIMGMAKGAFAIDADPEKSLLTFLQAFNQLLLKTMNRARMMTLFVFSLDVQTGTLDYLNAGHNYPFLWRAATGTISQLEGSSFPLGVKASVKFQSRQIRLDPGDLVLFYTDGFIEAADLAETQLGYGNAEAWFAAEARAFTSPEVLVDRLFARWRAYRGEAAQNDDVSLICLRRAGESANHVC